MEQWFQDKHTQNVRLDIKVKSVLYSGNSRYQKIEVLDTYEFGKMLVLDGTIMLSDRDEQFYHEMIVHVPMFSHKNPKDILVVGGGDGGVVREIMKHRVSFVSVVEIDEQVIELSKLYFPEISSKLNEKLVTVNIAPGEEFIRRQKDKFDVIVVDSTDSATIAGNLYEKEFYLNCFLALRTDGVMSLQIGSPLYAAETVGSVFKNLQQVFPITRLFLGYVPTYSNGFHSFAFCSKKSDPVKNFQTQRYRELDLPMVYYNEKVHQSSFILPNYVRNIIDGR